MSKFKGQALNFNIIIKQEAIENKTGSGIDITSATDKNEKYRKGIVVSVGTLCPKKDDGTESIKVGDEILYDKYKASEVTVDAIEYQVLSYSDLVMIL